MFTVTKHLDTALFESDGAKDGYVKASPPDGKGALVGACENLAIGSGWDGRDNRAILHFDTAAIPDNATLTRAYLEIKKSSGAGDIWAEGRVIRVDVQDGYFGASQAIQADDWKAEAAAWNAAEVGKVSTDSLQSSSFSPAGLNSINKTGVTQIRLRVDPPHGTPNNCIFIKDGADARLFIEYVV